MTDSKDLAKMLADYECESLPQMLREVAALSKHCTSEAGGRIPTWPLTEAADRISALEAEVVRLREAAKSALKRLEKGAPGWGVAKDELRTALEGQS